LLSQVVGWWVGCSCSKQPQQQAAAAASSSSSSSSSIKQQQQQVAASSSSSSSSKQQHQAAAAASSSKQQQQQQAAAASICNATNDERNDDESRNENGRGLMRARRQTQGKQNSIVEQRFGSNSVDCLLFRRFFYLRRVFLHVLVAQVQCYSFTDDKELFRDESPY